MKELREWQQIHVADTRAAFEALLSARDPPADQKKLTGHLDEDRRRISGFFEKVLVLDQLGVVSTREIALSWDVSTYRYIIDVLTPLEYAKADSMMHQGFITKEQGADQEQAEQVLIEFYRRVAAEHLRFEKAAIH